MAGRGFLVDSGEMTLTTSSKCFVYITPPADMPIVIREIWSSLRDATTAGQILVEFEQVDQDATGGTTVAPVFWGATIGTIQSAAKVEGGTAFTGQPTRDKILAPDLYLPPQGGVIYRGGMLIEPGQAFGLFANQFTSATAKIRIGVYAEE